MKTLNINDVTKFFCGEFPPFCKHKKGHQHQHKIFFKWKNSALGSKTCHQNIKIFIKNVLPYMAYSQNMVKFIVDDLEED